MRRRQPQQQRRRERQQRRTSGGGGFSFFFRRPRPAVNTVATIDERGPYDDDARGSLKQYYYLRRRRARPPKTILLFTTTTTTTPPTMTNVSEILSYNKSAQDDFYALLGCDQTSTVRPLQCVVVFFVFRFHKAILFDLYRSSNNFHLIPMRFVYLLLKKTYTFC